MMLLAACAWAQAFEAASIKPSAPEPANRFGFPPRVRVTIEPDGSFHATQSTLFDLIQRAYDRYDFQVTGGPEWVRTLPFDVDSRAPEGQADWRAMLRTLLAERFELRVQVEQRDLPMFHLTVTRRDRLRPSSAVCAPPCQPEFDTDTRAGVMTMKGAGVTMATLARWLTSPNTNREVRDATGLEGAFDIELTFAPEPLPGFPRLPGSENGPSIFTSLTEQLGLKLEPARGAAEVIVIESAARPSGN